MNTTTSNERTEHELAYQLRSFVLTTRVSEDPLFGMVPRRMRYFPTSLNSTFYALGAYLTRHAPLSRVVVAQRGVRGSPWDR
jgi:hypothetical protein